MVAVRDKRRHLSIAFSLLALAAFIIPALCAAAGKNDPAPAKDRRISAPASDASDASEARVALVIGNSAYKVSPLKNPVNDARSVAAALKKLGFDVEVFEDAGFMMMNEATERFGERLKKGGVGLFYYSGHGMQVRGENYLVPVDADIKAEGEVRYKTVNAGLLLEKMAEARNRVNIVILDACRNNPFARSFRSANTGLASMNAPSGTIVAYSTAPGSVASDGDGANGLYTGRLVAEMRTPGLRIEDVFKRVRAGVEDDSGGQQTPWESSSLKGDFYFAGGGEVMAFSAPAAVGPETSPEPVVEDPVEAEAARLRKELWAIEEEKRVKENKDRKVRELEELRAKVEAEKLRKEKELAELQAKEQNREKRKRRRSGRAGKRRNLTSEKPAPSKKK